MDRDPDQDSSADEEFYSNLFDDTYETHDEYFINFLLQRFINR